MIDCCVNNHCLLMHLLLGYWPACIILIIYFSSFGLSPPLDYVTWSGCALRFMNSYWIYYNLIHAWRNICVCPYTYVCRCLSRNGILCIGFTTRLMCITLSCLYSRQIIGRKGPLWIAYAMSIVYLDTLIRWFDHRKKEGWFGPEWLFWS